MLAYQVRRANSELTFYRNYNEALMILKSPAASLNKAQDLLDLTSLLLPWKMFGFDEEGFNFKLNDENTKGETVIGRSLEKTVPMYRTINAWFTPEEKLQMYSR
jgi:hypothetical protein